MNSTYDVNQGEKFYPDLGDYVNGVLEDFDDIPAERKETLEELARSVLNDIQENGASKLLFICTHNSRRSHMSQIWASTAAHHYGIKVVATYSGGTEVTAFNPRAVKAMERAGFKITAEGVANPVYTVSYSSDEDPLVCYSKKYDDEENPASGFIAIMTCSDADRNCPVVDGADERFLVSYEDPKAADNTPEEARRYDERCRQIATEMFFTMSIVAQRP